jgi:NAD(P)-dependent dehydrogenase (short-subunit alcohol dehydrogenase family)
MAERTQHPTAVITGAANGIGRAATQLFLANGWNVVALDLDGSGIDQLAASETASGTASETGGRLAKVAGDVSDPDAWSRVVECAVTVFGGVDALINNAGVAGPLSGLLDYPLDDFDRVMAVNVRGTFLGMRACIPLMLAKGGGGVVNVSSIVGFTGGRNIHAYTASKHAVLGLTKSAAVEFAARNVRVNAVCPSPTATEMMFSLERNLAPDDPESVRAAFANSSPMGRYGEPEEVAAAALWLCSPAASFVTGIALPVDGGMMAR